MRKILVTLMASLLSCSAATAFWPEATDSSLEIGVGYRRDKIEWRRFDNLLGSSTSNNSESGSARFGINADSKWKKLKIWQIEAKGKYVTYDNIYLRAYGDYGWIHSGRNSDINSLTLTGETDYELTHYRGKTGGHVYDADLALGYQFKLCDDSFSVSPLFGYAWKGQHLKDRHLRVTQLSDLDSSSSASSSDILSDLSFSSSSSGKLNNRYNTRWNGVFVGVDLDYRLMCEWSLFLDYKYHFANYHAKAKLALNPDVTNGFNHRSKRAHGNVLDFGVKWDFSDCWTLALKGGLQWFEAKHGRHRALVEKNSLAGVKEECFVSRPIKNVKWHSESISLDLGMEF